MKKFIKFNIVKNFAKAFINAFTESDQIDSEIAVDLIDCKIYDLAINLGLNPTPNKKERDFLGEAGYFSDEVLGAFSKGYEYGEGVMISLAVSVFERYGITVVMS